MRRWLAGLLVVLVFCVPIFVYRASSPTLLTDSDTKVLLEAIRERQNPLSWFAGDWPLQNHFYRPVSTLFFELDNALYGTRPEGYGLTNALVAIACVLMLFWFLRELTDHVVLSVASAAVFALWHVHWEGPLLLLTALAMLVAALGGLMRHGFKVGHWVPVVLLLLFVHQELSPVADLMHGVISWLPGRTASVMTLFLLPALACYARYERLGADRLRRPSTPLDPPATRNTRVQGESNRRLLWIWPIGGAALLWLALSAYEQAVMGPALLLGVAVSMRVRGYRVRWGWQALYWLLLIAYLVVRQVLVPADPSGYQQQAFRSGPGVILDLLDYALPAGALVPNFLASFVPSPYVLLNGTFWAPILALASSATALAMARYKWQLLLTGYAMSVLAFLPMAWLKFFPHYHYLPAAFRSFFVVTVAWLAMERLAIALSPPAIQAPPRPALAPGSLPRP